MKRKTWALIAAGLAVLAAAGWGAFRLTRVAASTGQSSSLPITQVKRGKVTITVAARGELQGGNSEMLTAPMTGGNDMAITVLRAPGELVQAGDVVVAFDTTEQEFKLREAEADLAEAEEQVAQAQATSQAKEEEARYQLLQAKAEVKLAELECKRNPLLAAITARQNTLALESARDRLRQLEHDLASRKATTEAGVAIQEAARNKARVKAKTARQNIDAMTLKAKTSGYVNVQQNTSGNFFMFGMQLPAYQVGDTVRAGMAVAQIPDLKNWEVSARIGELDRGNLAQGQPVEITAVALPGKGFKGKVKDLGNTSGPPWDRRFECKISLNESATEMRPGMSARILITTSVLDDAVWVPSQALFESDGRKFVYLRGPSGFLPHDVQLVKRSESQVVLKGVNEGQVVALANPDQMSKPAAQAGSAMKALSR
jgi:multidrug efflux pump subunit AcrA (membrane-fusion protein)